MLRRKALPVGTLFIVLVIALALLGVGYGLWSKTLYISGTVGTGTVDAVFAAASTTENDHGKEVGDCDATIDPDQDGSNDKLGVTLTNGYPSYECWVDFTVQSTGSIPIHIYQPEFTSLPPANEVTVQLLTAECYPDDHQLHENDISPTCRLYIHVEQDAAQSATYTFDAEIEARQFNEPRPPSP
jgi:hypothetical protein